jgi:uncharacterized protein YgiM (DUF1202 family)
MKQRMIMAFAGAFVLVAVGNALGAGAIVKRQAPLRSEPSTEHTAFMILTDQEGVKLIDPLPTSGYYHVRTSDGEEGWINSSNLEMDQDDP